MPSRRRLLKESPRMRGIKLVKTLEYLGIPPHRLDWKLQTGRLSPKEEWEIIKYLKARNISKAIDAIIFGREQFKDVSFEELIEKGWINENDIKFAKKIRDPIMR
jgi:hypothetical protein